MKPRILSFLFFMLMIASCAIVPQTINEPHYEEGEIKENVPFSVMASSDTNLIYWNNPSFEEDNAINL